MPAMDYQGSSVPFTALGRSILSIRREQVHAADGHDGCSGQELELEAFQKQVANQFHDLAGDGFLSLSWVHRLLDAFLCCQEEFRMIAFNSKSKLSKPPLDKMMAEFFERSVKALDVCNAIRSGIEQIRAWQRHLEIVLVALGTKNRAVGEGQFRRAKKALTDLAISMIEEKDGSSSRVAQRNRSFGRSKGDHRGGGHFRSLSWSVSRSWSAARQLQAIANNVTAPRSNEIAATGGMAVPVYTMSSVLLLVMWALVAAIPCQDRGLQVHFMVPRHFVWAQPVLALHEKILEESKKRERRNSCGLLKEIHEIERCSRRIAELVDSIQFPLSEEREMEVRKGVEELAKLVEAVKEGLDPLERQVREVFHRIVRSRTEGLDCLSHPE